MTTPAGGAVAAPSPIARRSAGHYLIVLMAFCGALVASWVVLGYCLPFPDVPVVREKIEQLGRFGDEYDILFVGSSRVYFQVLPSVFDQMLRDAGLPVRSFNAGIGALRPPEDGFYLDHLLRSPHRRLRWVFLEIMGLNAKNDPILNSTQRASYWHDWDRTRLLAQRSLAECTAALRRAKQREIRWSEAVDSCANSLGVLAENLGLFVEYFSAFGRGEPLLRRRFGSAKEKKDISVKEGLAWDGWAFPSIAKPWTEDPKRRTAYERAYADFLDTEQRFDSEDAVTWEALKSKIARITQAGATPILIIPPTLALKRYFPPELTGTSMVILDFSDPREHPELFAIDHRLDGQHLNYDGAEILTKEIARRFVEFLKKNGQLP